MPKVIYLICRSCDDSYYDGHATDDAYTTREAAERKLAELNGTDPGNDPYWPWWYSKTINLHT